MPGRPLNVRDVLLLVIVLAVAVPVVLPVTRAVTGDGDMRPVGSPAASGIRWSPRARRGRRNRARVAGWTRARPAPAVPGETTVVDGVQVLSVELVDGYYRPNRFTVQAGVPVKVVFTGWAQDCLGQPEFPELGLKGDMSTGQAVFPLGELKPGATPTCAMGVNEGTLPPHGDPRAGATPGGRLGLLQRPRRQGRGCPCATVRR